MKLATASALVALSVPSLMVSAQSNHHQNGQKTIDEVLKHERDILRKFFEDTGGDNWHRQDGWLSDRTPVCDWEGVVCDYEDWPEDLPPDRRLNKKISVKESIEQKIDRPLPVSKENKNRKLQNNRVQYGQVIGLDLPDNLLIGRVPDILYTLTRLERINFNYNSNLDVNFVNIGAACPDNGNGGLYTMKAHDTGTSSLNGVGGLANCIENLHVSGIRTSNTAIPEEIFTLTKLRTLHLGEMNLVGQIPDAIANLVNLEELVLYDNDMEGTIPGALQALRQNLRILMLSRNKFTGSMPDFINTFNALEEFYVENNQFEGSIPSLPDSPNLWRYYVNYNMFTGVIPDNFLQAVISTSSQINWDIIIDLSGNKLEGEIPAFLDELADIEVDLEIKDNHFTSMAPELCDNTNWIGLTAASDDDQSPVMDESMFSCDAIACPVGSWAPSGRQDYNNDCKICNNTYIGQSVCADRDDRGVLTRLFQETGGPDWKRRDGWLNDDVDICDWYGITCWDEGDDRDDRVRHIHLDNNNLKGTVPDNLYSLETLTIFTFARNPELTVSFKNIKDSPHMHRIDVTKTATTSFEGISNAHDFFQHLIANKLNIGGTIPKEIFQLTDLITLSMAECDITGTLSDEIGNMKSLEELYLYGNTIRGQIPNEGLSQLNNLKVFSMAKNALTGEMPVDALRFLPNLEAFSVTDQVTKGGGITGGLYDFSANPYMTTILLNMNKLEGPIPLTLLNGVPDNSAAIVPVVLDISNNMMTGTVPGTLSRFELMDLFVTENEFTGVDKALCSNSEWMSGKVGEFGCDAILCPEFTTNALGRRAFDNGDHNSECIDCTNPAASNYLGQTICGVAEHDLTEREILMTLYDITYGNQWKETKNWNSNVHICEWYGIDCDEANSVVSINLGNNGLVGVIPDEIYLLPNLIKLSLYGNAITMNFDGIDKALNLRSLILDETNVESLAGLNMARSLTELNVKNAKLSGPVPQDLAPLNNMEILTLSNNDLTGTIPDYFNQFPSLTGLHLDHNRLSGPLLPFTGLESLLYLDVSNNELTGEVPPNLLIDANPPDTQQLFIDLSSNKLTGVVPRDLERLERAVVKLNDNQITSIQFNLCNLDGWNNGNVEAFGCDGILCPAGTYNKIGHRSNDEPCELCDRKSASYMGSTTCSSATKQAMTVFVGLCTMVATTTMFLLF